jgi:hypothetical protein
MFFSSRTQTNIFLLTIQQSEYADVVTTYQSHVNAYLADNNDGCLPSNLRINGVATAIHLNASSRVQDVNQPRVRRVAGDWDSESWPPVDADPVVCSSRILSMGVSARTGTGPLSLLTWSLPL